VLARFPGFVSGPLCGIELVKVRMARERHPDSVAVGVTQGPSRRTTAVRELGNVVGCGVCTALLFASERLGLHVGAVRNEIDSVVATIGNWRDHFRASGVLAKNIDCIAPAVPPECFDFARSAAN